jgi:protein SCO1/2
MKNISRRSVMALLGAAPFAGALAARAGTREASRPAEDTPVQVISSRERLRQLHFPNVELITHEGKKVKFYDDLLKNKVVLINFMYAECTGVCPGITTNLVRVQKLLGDRVGRDIFMYSFTLKPEQDTPRKMAEYAKMHKAGPGWQFLTGAPADLELLRRKLGFTNPDPKLDQDVTQHIGNVRYGNEPLERWASCPGMAHATFIVEAIGWLEEPKTDTDAGKGERK